jgi:hypothetical protein
MSGLNLVSVLPKSYSTLGGLGWVGIWVPAGFTRLRNRYVGLLSDASMSLLLRGVDCVLYCVYVCVVLDNFSKIQVN